jgi:hypothetical protein
MTTDHAVALQMVMNGNIGNRIIQFLYLKQLQQHLGPSQIFGASIAPFAPPSADFAGTGRMMTIDGGHVHPVGELARRLIDDRIDCLHFGGYVQRMEYLTPVADMRRHLALPTPLDTPLFRDLTSDRHITCVVRANEVLRAIHPDYPPTPVAFYRAAVKESGRIPVFVGQTFPSLYWDALRRHFPDCIVYEHRNWLEDFRFILHSTSIAVAVSSFAWLAAYLSETARRIYLPLFGFLNPLQRRDVDLVPVGDTRFRLAAFEVMRWAGAAEDLDRITDPDRPVAFTAA